MANSLEVYKNTLEPKEFKSFVLVGNNKSMSDINKHQIKYFSLFSSPSNTFNIKNINTDVDGSFERFKIMLELLENRNNHYIKGYISCIGECPYEGDVPIKDILLTIKKY